MMKRKIRLRFLEKVSESCGFQPVVTLPEARAASAVQCHTLRQGLGRAARLLEFSEFLCEESLITEWSLTAAGGFCAARRPTGPDGSGASLRPWRLHVAERGAGHSHLGDGGDRASRARQRWTGGLR